VRCPLRLTGEFDLVDRDALELSGCPVGAFEQTVDTPVERRVCREQFVAVLLLVGVEHGQ
jgi:hypothetical protein